MSNAEWLVKLAKEKKDENAGRKALAAGAAAAIAGAKAPSNILGYHNVYHGNASRDISNKIRRTGLKTSFGGTGVSRKDDAISNAGTTNNVSRSKGKVYFSKRKSVAQQYTRNLFHTFGNPRNVVKGRMPHNQYRKAREDSLVRKLTDSAKGKTSKKDAYKSVAATSTHGIPSSRIKGGVGDKGRKQFATKKNIKRYLKSGSGKVRFAKGLVQAGTAVAGSVYAAKKLAEKARDRSKG